MRHMKFGGRAVKLLGLIVAVSVATFSCIPDNSDLGLHILPGDDTISIYTDTITGVHGMIVDSYPVQTSHNPANVDPGRLLYLGSLSDSLRGVVSAEAISMASITYIMSDFGDDAVIDSIRLSMYVSEVSGDTMETVNLKIFELIEGIEYNDSLYYSDFSMEGRYNEQAIVEENIELYADSLYTFYIDDPAFIEKIRSAASDTVFEYQELVWENFPGFYFRTEAVTPDKHVMAKISLGHAQSGLAFRFLPDTISIDTAEYSDYRTYGFTFRPSSCQWINIFEHDHTGLSFESIINVEDADPAIGVLNGLGGVTYKLNLTGLNDFILENPGISINGANLLFYVVPEEISGISNEDLPSSLMIEAIQENDSRLYLYDYVTNGNGGSGYGRLVRDNSQSAFSDPIYYYKFNISQHVQNLLMGTLDNTDLLISIANSASSTNVLRFWSNYSGMEDGLRLELIYSKF